MPAELSSVETLRAAAARLRETAKSATPGPWGVIWEHRVASGATQLDDDMAEYEYFVAELDSHDRDSNDIPNPHEPAADAHWVALVHPGVAEPLAKWLDTAADQLAVHLPVWSEVRRPYADREPVPAERVAELVESCFGPALRVARVLLGVPGE